MPKFFTPAGSSHLRGSIKIAYLVGKRNFTTFNTPTANPIKLHISTAVLHTFHPQIEHLRKASAPKNDLSSVDHVDKKSKHLVLYHDLVIVGSVRISPSQDSILNY